MRSGTSPEISFIWPILHYISWFMPFLSRSGSPGSTCWNGTILLVLDSDRMLTPPPNPFLGICSSPRHSHNWCDSSYRPCYSSHIWNLTLWSHLKAYLYFILLGEPATFKTVMAMCMCVQVTLDIFWEVNLSVSQENPWQWWRWL